MNPDIFVAIALPPPLQSLRAAPYTLHLGEGRAPDLPPEVSRRVRAIVTSGLRGAPRALIDCFPHLELIASFGAAVDLIDLPHARARGIRVTNTPGAGADDVADLAIAMIIDRLRGIRAANAFVLRGDWPRGPFPFARSLTGRRLGIVGLGAIGCAIAARAQACGMQVCWHGPRAKPEVPLPWFPDLAAMAEAVDVLVLSCPAGSATHHLVDARILAALGPEAVLVNVARGSVVDTAALIEALDQGRLGSAALDVVENQPQVPDALRNSDRVLLTPHLGTATKETRARMGAMLLASLADHFAGREPAHLVQMSAGPA
ncbi:MAG: 2-hydroxyacid dehydrogenase [Steroidobacteraceae bacterium]